MFSAYVFKDNGIVGDIEWGDVIDKSDEKYGGDCKKSLDRLGFYKSSEYYPKQNIEGMGITIYTGNDSSHISTEFCFLAVMSACNTQMQYVLIPDIPALYDFLARYLPVIKLADETMIDRCTHYD